MKKLAVILSVTLLIAATWFILWMIPPGMDRFEVTITTPDSIQPLETTSIEARLKNISFRPYRILHSIPLVFIEVVDQEGKSTGVIDLVISNNSIIRPGEEKTDRIQFSSWKPGVYEIRAAAKFEIANTAIAHHTIWLIEPIHKLIDTTA